jgi:uncharacterized protein YecE (DUF72 family)
MADQLPLFPAADLATAQAADAAVGPAAASADLVALGLQLPRELHLGTSSWFFPGWHGLVWDHPYDEATLSRNGLSAYAQHPLFRTVCIDRTFYAPLDRTQYADYAAQVPGHFRFVVKAPAACTQSWVRESRERGAALRGNPSFLDAECAVREFVDPCLEGLGVKAGALLFQFPPLGRAILRDSVRFVERLHTFLRALPAGPLYAVEVRDAQLLRRPFFAAVRDAGAHYCVAVHPRLPAIAVQAAAMAGGGPGPLVVRWNLNPRETYENARARYAPFDRLVDEDDSTRESIARLVIPPLGAREPVFVIANNKAEGSAPLTIEKLAESITSAMGAARAG